MKITNLKERPEFIDAVVSCLWKQWGTEKNENFYKSFIGKEPTIPGDDIKVYERIL